MPLLSRDLRTPTRSTHYAGEHAGNAVRRSRNRFKCRLAGRAAGVPLSARGLPVSRLALFTLNVFATRE